MNSQNNITIRYGTLDSIEIMSVVELLNLVFSKSGNFTYEYLDWLYKKNPEGQAITYNAISEGKIVGHYAVIPVEYMLFGRAIKGCLSLNTAVNPEYKKKGLFTDLAKKTYNKAYKLGYEFIFAIANSNSIHGFTSKLKFQLVGDLDVYLKYKFNFSIKKDFATNDLNEELIFHNIWSEKKLKWRILRPNSNYKYSIKNSYKIFCNTNIPTLDISIYDSAESESFLNLIKTDCIKKNRNLNPFYIWIGLNGSKRNNLYYLPTYMRPAPLHMIFRDLTDQRRVLDINKVKLSIFDFDAF